MTFWVCCAETPSLQSRSPMLEAAPAEQPPQRLPSRRRPPYPLRWHPHRLLAQPPKHVRGTISAPVEHGSFVHACMHACCTPEESLRLARVQQHCASINLTSDTAERLPRSAATNGLLDGFAMTAPVQARPPPSQLPSQSLPPVAAQQPQRPRQSPARAGPPQPQQPPPQARMGPRQRPLYAFLPSLTCCSSEAGPAAACAAEGAWQQVLHVLACMQP